MLPGNSVDVCFGFSASESVVFSVSGVSWASSSSRENSFSSPFADDDDHDHDDNDGSAEVTQAGVGGVEGGCSELGEFSTDDDGFVSGQESSV